MAEKVIEVNSLTKSYYLYDKPVDRLKESLSFFRHKSYHKEFLALNNISFDVKKGECFGIIGTNGSGKSTTLKILTGVLNQTSGSIKVSGKISALLELGAGFNMDYTGIENIYLQGMVLGYTKEEVEELIPKIKDFAEIGDFINQPVKLYSSGMFARLAFAVAINVDPDILIVDEALSVGDIFFQSKCYKKFDEFKALGKTILFVTHDMSSVLKYCDRVMLLNNGDLIKIGAPNDIVNIYKKILANSYDPEEENQEAVKEEKPNKNELWKSHLALNPHPQIYGNGKADILDFGVFNEQNEVTNSVNQSENICVRMKVKFNSDVTHPILAWKLKNNKGVEIIGTNTWYENIDFGEVKKGEIITITFKTKLFLITNQYLLDLGVTRFKGEELEVLCRNHEITTIDVLSTKQNVGFVNPMCEIDYYREI